MGGGRARAALVAGLISATALLAAGCGESRHANQQRPQVSTRVSVTITENDLIVQPTEVATGPEKSQQIPQNQNQGQPRIDTKGPVDVTFVVANQTAHDTELTVRGGGREVASDKIPARAPETFGGKFPAGTYTVSVGGSASSAAPAHLTVGGYRASSENDVLLP